MERNEGRLSGADPMGSRTRPHAHSPEHRSIQIGLSREAVDHYVDDWIIAITDITDLMRRIHAHLHAGDHDAARALLADETRYPLAPHLAALIGATT